jgi:small-conductance mechanosensitive channel/CRP-like cAMP-binding protein
MISGSMAWLLLAVIVFPVAMLVLGEIILQLRGKERKLARPLENVRNLVLPTVVFYTVLSKIIKMGEGTIAVRLAETLMWITIIYTALTFLNLFLFEDARDGTWQANVPKIFLDTSRFFLILVGSAIVLSNVWGADLGGLITALGVGSLVIGLALQDSLGNVFSGVALLFERPVKLGEWIRVGDTTGKVEEITWRSVILLTQAGDLVIVPNSELAKGSIYNFSRPTPTYEISLELGFSCDDPPNKVKKILTETALETEEVLATPAPQVITFNYGDFSVTYQILLYIADFGPASAIRDRFMTRVWYAVKRGGLTMPYPIATEFEYRPIALTPEQQNEISKKAMKSVPAIGLFDDETLDLLSKRGTWLDYAHDEIVVTEGEELAGLYLVIEGTAELSVRDQTGSRQTIAKVGAGEFFGEKASLLSEQIGDVTVQAIEDLTLLLLDTATIQLMLEHSPRLANDLGEIMELRRRAIRALQN